MTISTEVAWHPVADIFPMMSDQEYADLVVDVREHGVREPVWLHRDGRIVDGRNRWRAAQDTGTAVATRTYEGDDSTLVAFVLSLNLQRRHLNSSQRAMVADRVALLRQGQRADTAIAVSQEQAAEQLNVSVDSVQRARVVREQGVPELGALVEAGGLAVSTAAAIAQAPPDEQREVIALDDERGIVRRAKEIIWRRREERRQQKAKKIEAIRERQPEPLANIGPYPVIYADPPWQYQYERSLNRVIENHYPTMALDDIKKLEVPAADDAVLFLWVTSPKLVEGLDVMEAWGFDYRSCMVWVKDQIGMGYYARQQHELLLIGKRGNLSVPDPEDRPPSVITAPRTEHSAKPDAVYDLIERMYPLREWCELFQRRPRARWAGWGNQA